MSDMYEAIPWPEPTIVGEADGIFFVREAPSLGALLDYFENLAEGAQAFPRGDAPDGSNTSIAPGSSTAAAGVEYCSITKCRKEPCPSPST